MQARRTLVPGQKGSKKCLDHYGEKLTCVRYRYDQRQHKRRTTVESIVEESAWTPSATPIVEPMTVGLRVGLSEVAIQRQLNKRAENGIVNCKREKSYTTRQWRLGLKIELNTRKCLIVDTSRWLISGLGK